MKLSNLKFSYLLFLFIFLSGCEAFLIPKTDDPVKKLGWADNSLEMQRPIPAERLLNEAIPYFKKENNIGMLGAAYNIYGRLHYSHPKRDDINFSNAIRNFEISLEYLEEFFRSGGPYKDDEYYNLYHQLATNSAFYLGELYHSNKNDELACEYFDKSYEYYEAQLEIKPDAEIKAQGYNNFEEGIKDKKTLSNCSLFTENKMYNLLK